MNDDGSNQVQLTSTTDSLYPDISPDGTKIVFAKIDDSPGSDNQYDIWVVNTDGSGLTQLTNGTEQDMYPVWSPDGTKIAFSRSDRTFGWPPPDIYVMNADGSNPSRLLMSPTISNPRGAPTAAKSPLSATARHPIQLRLFSTQSMWPTPMAPMSLH
jgi:TolB protein